MKTKREKIEELIKQGWLMDYEKEKILKAFGYEVSEVSYLYVESSTGDYVGTTQDKELDEIIDLNEYPDAYINEVYDELSEELDLEA